jgi:hypothetical protein
MSSSIPVLTSPLCTCSSSHCSHCRSIIGLNTIPLADIWTRRVIKFTEAVVSVLSRSVSVGMLRKSSLPSSSLFAAWLSGISEK